MKDIIIPALIMGGIALLLGSLLAVASVVFKVKKNEKAEKIREALPGANCGGCGYAGCSAYADAVVSGAEINLCTAGGQKAQDAIAEIMGVEKCEFVEKRAQVLCGGECGAVTEKNIYDGVCDCLAAERVGMGPKNCTYGCLGLGSCVSVCRFDAISIVNGIAKISESKCTACGMCVKICPRGVIELKPAASRVYVRCVSHDKGAEVRKNCGVGCIGCGICQKNCPADAITLNDGVAEIDSSKCSGCGICAEKCPQKCIAAG